MGYDELSGERGGAMMEQAAPYSEEAEAGICGGLVMAGAAVQAQFREERA
jgi:hypothetical protein